MFAQQVVFCAPDEIGDEIGDAVGCFRYDGSRIGSLLFLSLVSNHMSCANGVRV